MKRVLPVALAIVGLLAFAAPAPAQQFPERTVTIVVHLPPEEAAKPEAARIGEAFALCVPNIRFGMDAENRRDKLAA